jgi:hypothetical protein
MYVAQRYNWLVALNIQKSDIGKESSNLVAKPQTKKIKKISLAVILLN